LYTIELGVHDRNAPESWSVTRKGRLIVMNAGWSPVDFRNDIAMIKLDVNNQTQNLLKEFTLFEIFFYFTFN